MPPDSITSGHRGNSPATLPPSSSAHSSGKKSIAFYKTSSLYSGGVLRKPLAAVSSIKHRGINVKTTTRLLSVLIAIASLSGCVSTGLKNLNDMALASQEKNKAAAAAAAGPTPEPGKAMVVFMGELVDLVDSDIRAFIYDGDTYIGISQPNTKFAYQAEPGKHVFMLASDNAAFMWADLEAGKTYYTRLTPAIADHIALSASFRINPKTGIYRFYLYPGMDPTTYLGKGMIRSLNQHKTAMRWVDAKNEGGFNMKEYDAIRMALDIPAMKAKYLPVYEAKDDNERFLRQ